MNANDAAPNWQERRNQAEELCSRSVAARLSPEEEEMVLRLAADPKWEVRKVFAENLSRLPDNLFLELRPRLFSDSNAYVSRAARISSERRLPSATLNAAPPGKIQKAIDRIDSKYGSAAASEAVKFAHLLTERHIRSAVHDIKNILASLTIDLKQFQGLSEIQQRKLVRFSQASDYLKHLTEVMACYSSEPEIACQPESLSEIIEDARSSAVEQLAKGGRSLGGVEFESSIPEGLKVNVSRFHMVMALTNLIKNGFEAHAISEGEMASGAVAVEASVTNGEVIIAIIDEGRGIAPADLSQLREFIPGGSSKAKMGGLTGSGTGYGLPICRRYVEAHGGTLEIESKVGVGTKVTLRIPKQNEEEER